MIALRVEDFDQMFDSGPILCVMGWNRRDGIYLVAITGIGKGKPVDDLHLLEGLLSAEDGLAIRLLVAGGADVAEFKRAVRKRT